MEKEKAEAEAKVEEMMQKIAELKESDSKEIQSLLSTKRTLESNLTAELEKEKVLEAKNLELQKELEAIKAKAKEEAERLAKEQAELKAKEAKSKLEEAFSLTNVAFRTGSAVLTTESKRRLDKAIEVMKKYDGYRYNIQGHTDNRGKESFNKMLSTKRAKAVKDYLVSKGVDASILTYEGFGSERPIADNNTKEGREKNRRVVFEIIQQ